MALTYGELLFGVAYLDIDINPEMFYDKELQKFVKLLKEKGSEYLQNMDNFSGISPTPITKEKFIDLYNSQIFTKAVNDRVELLQGSLMLQDWTVLNEEFPKLASDTLNSANLKTGAEISLDDSEFIAFYDQWDTCYRGLLAEDFIIVYGMSKMGKSNLTANIAYQAIKAGYTVGFYPTELSISVTLKYILGFELGLKGNEALEFFNRHPQELGRLRKKYGNNIIFPSTHIFNWKEYEALYQDKRVQIVFQDNFVRCIAQLGLSEDASSASQLARKFSTMQQKYRKPTFIVTQETTRPATPKELEDNPGVYEIGLGHTFMTKSMHQEASLGLNIVKRPGTQIREIRTVSDRFRGVTDADTMMSIEVDKQCNLKTDCVKSSYQKNVDRVEKAYLKREERDAV
jgi:hypothetical protein